MPSQCQSQSVSDDGDKGQLRLRCLLWRPGGAAAGGGGGGGGGGRLKELAAVATSSSICCIRRFNSFCSAQILTSRAFTVAIWRDIVSRHWQWLSSRCHWLSRHCDWLPFHVASAFHGIAAPRTGSGLINTNNWINTC